MARYLSFIARYDRFGPGKRAERGLGGDERSGSGRLGKGPVASSLDDMAFVPPPADPAKLLATWLLWEKGEETPGRVLADLKTAGMRELLESLVNPA